MLSTLGALWLATTLPCPQDAGNATDPVAELARLVDLPTPAERRRAADALALRGDVDVDAWLAAMRAFAPAGPPDQPEVVQESTELWNGDRLEQVELHAYVPQDLDPTKPAPLLLMSHGTGGSGRGQHRFWRGTADALGMIVVAPSESGPNEGYAYSERERQIALASIRWARRRFDVDEDRVFLTGISRGGHLTWDLALRYPDLCAAIAPMIGGPRLNIGDGQNNLRYLENVVHLPIRDLQGSQDHPLLLFNLHLAFEKLDALKAADAKLIEFPERGHSFEMLRFGLNSGADTHFGWAQITRVDSTHFTLHGFGYNNTPGAASHPANTVIPEPSSVLLLAAGAAGLGMWRRRRLNA